MSARYTGTCRHCGRHLERTLREPWDEHGIDAFLVDCPNDDCDRSESMVYRDDPDPEDQQEAGYDAEAVRIATEGMPVKIYPPAVATDDD